MRLATLAALTSALGVLDAAPAPGQVLYAYEGTLSDGSLGNVVDGLGDVDGDGYDDFLVGEEGRDPSGRVMVLSGRDGSVVHLIDGTAFPDNGFATDASGIGDVNSDGRGDFAVGAWLDDTAGNNAGSVTVFSGLDGTVLYEVFGLETDGVFGYQVSGLGDIDGDGAGEVLVGAPNATGPVAGSGYVAILSGVDGALLLRIDREPGDSGFGRSLADAGDVDGDGYDDLLVGLEHDDTNGDNAGAARVYSGVSGAILHDLLGDAANDHYGRGVDGVGDVDGDGHDDFLVSASGSDFAGPLSGMVRLYSGFDATVLQQFVGLFADDALGDTVAGIGDVDGDGRNDIALGSTRSHLAGPLYGHVRVHSGATGTLLRVWHGDETVARFGDALGDAGDLNGDGVPDVLVGAFSHGNMASAPGPGKAWAFSGSLAGVDAYCFADGQGASCPCGNLDPMAGCAHAGGHGARLLVTGSTSLTRNDLVFTVLDAPLQTAGMLLLGDDDVSIPLQNGSLCLGGPILRLVPHTTLGFGGFIEGPGLPPAKLAGVSSSSTFQVYYRDSGGPCGGNANFTNAIEVIWRP